MSDAEPAKVVPPQESTETTNCDEQIVPAEEERVLGRIHCDKEAEALQEYYEHGYALCEKGRSAKHVLRHMETKCPNSRWTYRRVRYKYNQQKAGTLPKLKDGKSLDQ